MSFFDETRDNIKVQELADSDRKELLNKFVDAGGEVIKPKKKKPMVINRDKQREISSKMDSHYSKQKSRQKSSSDSYSRSSGDTYSDDDTGVTRKKNFIEKIIDSIQTRIHLNLFGIIDFSTTILSAKFLGKYNSNYKNALIRLQVLYLEIFKRNTVLANRIMEQLDSQRPIYFELIEMTADLYDKTLNGQLIDSFIAFPNEQQNVVDYRIPILAFFKKIYPLYLYQDLILTSFEKAIRLQTKLEKKKQSEATKKIKQVKNDLYIVFHKFFPALYWLFCKFQGSIIDLRNNAEIEKILLIGPDMMPGNRVASAPSTIDPENIGKRAEEKTQKEKEEMEKAREELKKSTEEVIPEHIQSGLAEIEKLRPETLQKNYANRDNLTRQMTTRDKVFVTFLYFSEFDHELAFLLTTNKIKYNTITDKNHRKINYKDIFEGFFNHTNQVYDSFKQYFSSSAIYQKAIEDKPISKEHYIKYSKKITEHEKDRKNKAGAARHTTASYFSKLGAHLEFVLKNINSINTIVVNPNSTLDFDSGIESSTKLKGKTIKEAFEYLYEFSTAFAYMLSPAGDLYGDIEIKDELPQDTVEDGNETSEPSGFTEEPRETVENKPSASSESVMNELEDFIN